MNEALKEFERVLTVGQANPQLRGTLEYRKAFRNSRDAVMRPMKDYLQRQITHYSDVGLVKNFKKSTLGDIVRWCNENAEGAGVCDNPMSPLHNPTRPGYFCTVENFGQ